MRATEGSQDCSLEWVLLFFIEPADPPFGTSGYDKPDSFDNQRLDRVRYYRILYVYVVFIIYTLGMMMFVIFVNSS